ncbi:MAG: aspartate/glutamate racemase family protein [Candidatus Pacebacteria bacterium]|nr:aspartate/glutamate racemase family protein [Candidatus Paceibacterota bacterium]PIR63712.1 MAG: hypothetical protein COU64_03185 [Candidatus Pacebacteria bacterium CG10_big_fil_rev_8_21_14_0_10_40_26]PIZ79715.1 MAG: hypothetical protein COY01_00225 [Candidatus Pacebacteria bacterium CG_4_10_14_0_2_um_filter_40_20]PJA68359.1 MAG: hypothetical protein CO156_05180 [Candidatus Pacebacteria bacterium CG_4_9_14_3_um_filter_40_12]PJC41221.1 MAG: hypothetical protein CO041_05250 [Candidatus Pacebac
MKNTTCIGILGGVGPQATEYLYKKLISGAVLQHGVRENHEFPRVLIISEPVIDFISSKEHLPKARKQVLAAVERLILGGVSHLAIASNTVHLLAEEVSEICHEHGVEFISMLEAVARYCRQCGYTSVGLLGSPVTLSSNLYDTALHKEKIRVIKPSEGDYPELGCIIKKVIADKVTSADEKKFVSLLIQVASECDAVILGCTELPVLATALQLSTPVVDTSSILAEVLLEKYFGTTKQTTTKEQQS